jgi:hypothetical protein
MAETQAVTNYIQDLAEYEKRNSNSTPAIFVKTTKTTLKSSNGPYGKIQLLTTGCISSIISTQISGIANLSSATTFAAGTEIVGNMSAIKLSNKGQFLIYKWS